jgi:hypothetical protein
MGPREREYARREFTQAWPHDLVLIQCVAAVELTELGAVAEPHPVSIGCDARGEIRGCKAT